MRFSTIAALLAAFIAPALAQSSTYVEPNVPTGVPIAGNYTGGLRPQIHFSPPKDFMNDPNGMFRDANGTWHLYYQYNPTGIVAGNQHWGHATSQDLYHWINQPIAIYAINASSYIFTGSAVVDANNTSGFFPNQDNGVVAIFTIATYAPIMLESQGIAYSFDGGYTFTMYSGNPVLDIGSDQFRDPKVFWYEDHWVMAVAYAQEFVIGLFTSPDLKNWTHASNFSHHGLLALQYECPNLVEVPVEGSDDTMWLLQISINPGAPQGGSISQYFLGGFDGYTFTPVDNVTRISDFARDSYAGQFFGNLPKGEAVVMNWASNWAYSQEVPTGPLEGWRSAMSLPRKVSVGQSLRTGLTQVVKPYDLTPVIGDTLAMQTLGNGSFAVDFSSTPSNALYISVNITNLPPAANISGGTLNGTFLSPISGEYLQFGYFFGGDNYFWVNRGGVRGFDYPLFSDKFMTNVLLNGTWNMQAVIDRSLFETFVMDGQFASTTEFFPEDPLTIFSFAAGDVPGNASISAAVYALKSAWAEYENENGTVVGNVTSSSSNSTMARRHAKMLYEAEFA